MHTVPFKLNQPANVFQAGDATGFGIRCGIKAQNPKTKQDEWTNYNAVIFAKSPAQIQFYTNTLVEGTMAVVSAEKLQVEQYQGNTGLQITLNMLNARLEAVHTGQSTGQAPQQNAQPAQRQGQNQAANAPDTDSFDDDIPF